VRDFHHIGVHGSVLSSHGTRAYGVVWFVGVSRFSRNEVEEESETRNHMLATRGGNSTCKTRTTMVVCVRACLTHIVTRRSPNPHASSSQSLPVVATKHQRATKAPLRSLRL